MCTCKYIYTYLYTYTHTHIYIFAYLHTCVHISISTYIHIHTSTYIYIHLHTYKHIKSYIQYTVEARARQETTCMTDILGNPNQQPRSHWISALGRGNTGLLGCLWGLTEYNERIGAIQSSRYHVPYTRYCHIPHTIHGITYTYLLHIFCQARP